jgi:membrane protein
MRIPGFAEQAPLEVVKHAIKDFFADDMLTYAAALAYHLLLALFPFIIFLLALLGSVGLDQFFDDVLQQARTALPQEAYLVVAEIIGEIRGQPRQGLISLSIVLALWAASAGMRSVTNALNVAYDVRETRPAWQRYTASVLATLGLGILFLVAGAFRLIGPEVATALASRLGLAGFVPTLWVWLRWPVVILLLLLVVAVVYKVAPNVDQPFRYVTPGSVTAILVWLLASAGFAAYVARFGNYGATYGSLGGMIVLILYFYISGAVLLFGAEINATIHPALAQPPGEPAQAAPSPDLEISPPQLSLP